MSDSKSQSPPPPREGFERRWIKNAKYTGPERRSGVDRRRYPPVKDGADPNSKTTDEQNGAEAPPEAPDSGGTFKPYRP
jgi:hypothetical protein